MGWIKRNLAFVVIGIVALIALGGEGFYIYQGMSRNSEQTAKLTEYYTTLQQLNQEQPQPGNEKKDNLKHAKEQEQQLRDWIRSTADRFAPIQPVPEGPVTSKTYAQALNSTVYQLTQEAKEDSVSLPPKYNFSFQVQSTKLNISSGLGPLAQQLGEVKAIAEILFAARVNSLDGIQRVRVSDDDAGGEALQSDYTDKTPVTNELAIITPYAVTFESFTPELAQVLSGFATSTNPFIVKSVSVQPAGAAGSAPGVAGVPPMPTPDYPHQGYPGYPGYPGYRGGYPGYPGYPGGVPGQPPTAPAGKGGLQTVLDEQLLRITLEVDIVQLLPKT